MPVFELTHSGKTFEIEAPDEKSALDVFQKANPPSAMADFGAQLGVGAIHGVTGTIGTPRQVTDAVVDLTDKYLPMGDTMKNVAKAVAPRLMMPFYPPIPATDKLNKKVEEFTGPLPTPQTTAGEYGHRIGEFLPGSLLGPAGKASQVAGNVIKYGVLPAVAAQATGDLPGIKGTSAEPWVRGGATLATGGITALGSRPSSGVQAIAGDLGNLTEAELRPIVQNAEMLIRDAANRGVNLTWAQAIEQTAPGATNLPKLQRYIERTETGANALKPFYAGQPEAMQTAVENVATQIAPRSANPSSIGPAASQEAQGVLRRVEDAINRHTRPLYRQAEPQKLPQGTYDAISQNPSYQEALRQIRNNPELNAAVANLPDESVGVVDLVRRQLQAAAEAGVESPRPNDRLLASIRGQQGDLAENAATGAVPPYAQAQAEQAALRSQYLNPLEQGPLGGVARADGTQGAINAMFPRTPQAGSEGEVATAITALGRNNPTIPENIVSQHMRNTANQQMKQNVGGENYYGGARFAAELAGNPQAETNFLSATQALPQGAQRRSEVENLIEVLRATGKRLPEGAQTSTDLLKNDAMKPRSLLNPRRFVDFGEDAYQKWRLQKSAEEAAYLLQNPEAASIILRASGLKQSSPLAAILLNSAQAQQ